MFLADTNVLLDVAVNDPTWSNWSSQALQTAIAQGDVAINPIIYAELSVCYDTVAATAAALANLGVQRLSLPYEAAFLAGRAFLRYRRAGGVKTAPLPDFYIGAHAEVAKLTVLTRDPRPFRTYFPDVILICP